jgi:hypothetical protein
MIALRALGFVSALLLLGLVSADPAKAALVWEFSFTGEDFSGGGAIVFKEPTGDTIGGVSEFDFMGQTFGHDWGCSGVDCLLSARWTILPDWTITDFFILTDQVLSDDGMALVDIFETLPLSEPPVSQCLDAFNSSFVCPGAAGNTSLAFADTPIVLEPVHISAVPLPAALLLFGSGLAALFGWMGIGRWRQTAQA